jgi:hypothetical protein
MNYEDAKHLTQEEVENKIEEARQLWVLRNVYSKPKEVLNPLVRLTTEELDEKEIQKPQRNPCVHHYVPLRDCRRKNSFYPGSCEDEKIRYERCAFKLQMKLKEKSQRIYEMERKIDRIDKLIAEKQTK